MSEQKGSRFGAYISRTVMRRDIKVSCFGDNRTRNGSGGQVGLLWFLDDSDLKILNLFMFSPNLTFSKQRLRAKSPICLGPRWGVDHIGKEHKSHSAGAYLSTKVQTPLDSNCPGEQKKKKKINQRNTFPRRGPRSGFGSKPPTPGGRRESPISTRPAGFGNEN